MGRRITILVSALVFLNLFLIESHSQVVTPETRSRIVLQAVSPLTGVYRIDITESDKLYSVVAGASSNLPFREQQRFFIDLAVRLTPPDLLAIESRGQTVSLASSRAPRITFEADGVMQLERTSDGRSLHTRALLSGNSLTVNTSGGTDDSFSVRFESIDAGQRLRVTRRISAPQLNESLVVQSIYNKISNVARWDIYGEPINGSTVEAASASTNTGAITTGPANLEANALRESLDEWLEVTNARDLRRLTSFYAPDIKAFYLARNVSRAFVRSERARAFNELNVISVRAEEPEIIFIDRDRIAVMRFRKQYLTVVKGRRRQGEVIQELRWQKTGAGWRIFSERDVRVIR
jgi:hypothetical protein